MIVDFACDFKECDAPVEFIRGQVYRSESKSSTIYFFRCLNQHSFQKNRKDVGLIQEDSSLQWFNEIEPLDYFQDELPFDN